MQNMGGKQGVLWEMGKLGIEFCPLTYAAFFKMDIINYQLIFVTSEANKQNTSAGMKTLVYSENGQDASINKSEIARINFFSFSFACACAPDHHNKYYHNNKEKKTRCFKCAFILRSSY